MAVHNHTNKQASSNEGEKGTVKASNKKTKKSARSECNIVCSVSYDAPVLAWYRQNNYDKSLEESKADTREFLEQSWSFDQSDLQSFREYFNETSQIVAPKVLRNALKGKQSFHTLMQQAVKEASASYYWGALYDKFAQDSTLALLRLYDKFYYGEHAAICNTALFSYDQSLLNSLNVGLEQKFLVNYSVAQDRLGLAYYAHELERYKDMLSHRFIGGKLNLEVKFFKQYINNCNLHRLVERFYPNLLPYSQEEQPQRSSLQDSSWQSFLNFYNEAHDKSLVTFMGWQRQATGMEEDELSVQDVHLYQQAQQSQKLREEQILLLFQRAQGSISGLVLLLSQPQNLVLDYLAEMILQQEHKYPAVSLGSRVNFLYFTQCLYGLPLSKILYFLPSQNRNINQLVSLKHAHIEAILNQCFTDSYLFTLKQQQSNETTQIIESHNILQQFFVDPETVGARDIACYFPIGMLQAEIFQLVGDELNSLQSGDKKLKAFTAKKSLATTDMDAQAGELKLSCHKLLQEALYHLELLYGQQIRLMPNIEQHYPLLVFVLKRWRFIFWMRQTINWLISKIGAVNLKLALQGSMQSMGVVTSLLLRSMPSLSNQDGEFKQVMTKLLATLPHGTSSKAQEKLSEQVLDLERAKYQIHSTEHGFNYTKLVAPKKLDVTTLPDLPQLAAGKIAGSSKDKEQGQDSQVHSQQDGGVQAQQNGSTQTQQDSNTHCHKDSKSRRRKAQEPTEASKAKLSPHALEGTLAQADASLLKEGTTKAQHSQAEHSMIVESSSEFKRMDAYEEGLYINQDATQFHRSVWLQLIDSNMPASAYCLVQSLVDSVQETLGLSLLPEFFMLNQSVKDEGEKFFKFVNMDQHDLMKVAQSIGGLSNLSSMEKKLNHLLPEVVLSALSAQHDLSGVFNELVAFQNFELELNRLHGAMGTTYLIEQLQKGSLSFTQPMALLQGYLVKVFGLSQVFLQEAYESRLIVSCIYLLIFQQTKRFDQTLESNFEVQCPSVPLLMHTNTASKLSSYTGSKYIKLHKRNKVFFDIPKNAQKLWSKDNASAQNTNAQNANSQNASAQKSSSQTEVSAVSASEQDELQTSEVATEQKLCDEQWDNALEQALEQGDDNEVQEQLIATLQQQELEVDAQKLEQVLDADLMARNPILYSQLLAFLKRIKGSKNKGANQEHQDYDDNVLEEMLTRLKKNYHLLPKTHQQKEAELPKNETKLLKQGQEELSDLFGMMRKHMSQQQISLEIQDTIQQCFAEFYKLQSDYVHPAFVLLDFAQSIVPNRKSRTLQRWSNYALSHELQTLCWNLHCTNFKQLFGLDTPSQFEHKHELNTLHEQSVEPQVASGQKLAKQDKDRAHKVAQAKLAQHAQEGSEDVVKAKTSLRQAQSGAASRQKEAISSQNATSAGDSSLQKSTSVPDFTNKHITSSEECSVGSANKNNSSAQNSASAQGATSKNPTCSQDFSSFLGEPLLDPARVQLNSVNSRQDMPSKADDLLHSVSHQLNNLDIEQLFTWNDLLSLEQLQQKPDGIFNLMQTELGLWSCQKGLLIKQPCISDLNMVLKQPLASVMLQNMTDLYFKLLYLQGRQVKLTCVLDQNGAHKQYKSSLQELSLLLKLSDIKRRFPEQVDWTFARHQGQVISQLQGKPVFASNLTDVEFQHYQKILRHINANTGISPAECALMDMTYGQLLDLLNKNAKTLSPEFFDNLERHWRSHLSNCSQVTSSFLLSYFDDCELSAVTLKRLDNAQLKVDLSFYLESANERKKHFMESFYRASRQKSSEQEEQPEVLQLSSKVMNAQIPTFANFLVRKYSLNPKQQGLLEIPQVTVLNNLQNLNIDQAQKTLYSHQWHNLLKNPPMERLRIHPNYSGSVNLWLAYSVYQCLVRLSAGILEESKSWQAPIAAQSLFPAFEVLLFTLNALECQQALFIDCPHCGRHQVLFNEALMNCDSPQTCRYCGKILDNTGLYPLFSLKKD